MFLVATCLRAKFEFLFFRLSHDRMIRGSVSEVKLGRACNVHRNSSSTCQTTGPWDRARWIEFFPQPTLSTGTTNASWEEPGKKSSRLSTYDPPLLEPFFKIVYNSTSNLGTYRKSEATCKSVFISDSDFEHTWEHVVHIRRKSGTMQEKEQCVIYAGYLLISFCIFMELGLTQGRKFTHLKTENFLFCIVSLHPRESSVSASLPLGVAHAPPCYSKVSSLHCFSSAHEMRKNDRNHLGPPSTSCT